jgi:hypothetical protein
MKAGEPMTGVNVILAPVAGHELVGALPMTDASVLIGNVTETDIRSRFVWLRGGPAAPHAVPRRSV